MNLDDVRAAHRAEVARKAAAEYGLSGDDLVAVLVAERDFARYDAAQLRRLLQDFRARKNRLARLLQRNGYPTAEVLGETGS